MQREARAAWRVGLTIVALAAVSGCASPRVVTAITSSRDQIKFLYLEGNAQGVIKCKVGADGALAECRPMAVVFQE